jgi:hypothetical protein
MWIGPTGGEGAKFWMTVLTELRNHGVQDTFIVCCDGLKGLPESIRTTNPQFAGPAVSANVRQRPRPSLCVRCASGVINACSTTC